MAWYVPIFSKLLQFHPVFKEKYHKTILLLLLLCKNRVLEILIHFCKLFVYNFHAYVNVANPQVPIRKDFHNSQKSKYLAIHWLSLSTECTTSNLPFEKYSVRPNRTGSAEPFGQPDRNSSAEPFGRSTEPRTTQKRAFFKEKSIKYFVKFLVFNQNLLIWFEFEMRHLQMKVVLKLCISCYKLGWFLVKFWPILGQSSAERFGRTFGGNGRTVRVRPNHIFCRSVVH